MSSITPQHWTHENPRAVVVLIHGLGEFCGRYDSAAKKFVENEYAVVSTDLPGHGPRAERRGHINAFTEFLDTAAQLIAEAEAAYPGKPIILFGHSMGGLITVRLAQTRPLPPSVRAIMLSSPSLQTSISVPPATIKVARFISRVWPTLQQASRISPSAVSRSPEVQEFYRTNNDILHKTSIRFLVEFLDAMDASVAAATSVDVPVLTLQAGADKLVSVAATTQFHDTLISPQKDFKLYPECYHELLNEPERDEVFQDMVNWLHAQSL